MKRKVIVLLVFIIFLLASCGDSDTNSNDESTDNNTSNQSQTSEGQVTENQKNITNEEAETIALKHANLKAKEVSNLRSERSEENGEPSFDVEFVHNRIDYEYSIEASTGVIISFDRDISEVARDNGNRITEKEAIEIALKELPGAKATDVQRIRLDNDDDGWAVYEGSISFDNFIYEFDVSAINGMILSWDRE